MTTVAPRDAVGGSDHRPDRLPSVNGFDAELARLDAVATIDALDRGELSVSEVVRAAIARANALGPQLGAVAFERYGKAVASLHEVRPRRGAFDGVPTNVTPKAHPTPRIP